MQHRPHRSRRRPAGLIAAAAMAATLASCSSAAALAPTSTTTVGRGGAPGSTTATTTNASTASTSTTTPSTSTSSTSTTVPALVTNPAGKLPQTTAYPSADDPQFQQEMRALWQGIVSDSLPTAIHSFFPEAAYDQVKAISNPDLDWHDRLVGDFQLDLAAAHQYVTQSGQPATFDYVAVPPSGYSAWIPPGGCYNSIGYWHSPGARIVYRQGGVTRSIGIASLISWRGEWYVVHFGAVLRSTEAGIVNSPSTGQGEFAPPGGC